MTSFQRLIKLFALALAAMLIFGIFFGVGTALISLTLVNDNSSGQTVVNGDASEILFSEAEADRLDIDIAASDFQVKAGDKLSVYISSGEISARLKRDKLTVNDKKFNLFNTEEKRSVILTVPADKVFSDINIELGAGNMTAEIINCDNLDFDLGVGGAQINRLVANKKAQIEGGTGKLIIEDAEINNLDCSLGIGKGNISAVLTGKSYIEAGIGELNINVKGSQENYRIDARTGLGNFRINGEKITDDTVIGNGENQLNIEGGIGKVSLSFE